MKKHLLFALLLLFMKYAQAHTVSGYITGQESGEPLGYASVSDTLGRQGVYSNLQGYFSLSLAPGRHVLHVSNSGYQPLFIDLDIRGDTTLQVALSRLVMGLDTVRIVWTKAPVQPGRLTLATDQLIRIPALGGEADILKSLQLTPGVTFGLEGSGNLFVRGGSPDQNLVLLDEMPVYNVNHLFGYFSIFPAEAIKTVSLIKGNFPARYGGRLSSVLEIQTKDGSVKEWKKSLSLSTLAAHITVEGPLAKDKSALMFVFRRSWLDLLLRPATTWAFNRQEAKGSATYGFYDMIGKVTFIPDNKSRLSLSVYAGQDRGSVTLRNVDADSSKIRTETGLNWGNLTLSLRYQRTLGKRLFIHAVTGYTQYGHQNTASAVQFAPNSNKESLSVRNEFGSLVSESLAKGQAEWYLGERHTLIGGIQASVRAFRPNLLSITTEEGSLKSDTLISPEKVWNTTGSLYAEYQFTPGPRLSLNMGLRADLYGVDDFFQLAPQPRLSLTYRFSERFSANLSYSRIVQHLHLLTSSGIGLQADIWTPATRRFAPARSPMEQWTLLFMGEWDQSFRRGIFQDFPGSAGVQRRRITLRQVSELGGKSSERKRICLRTRTLCSKIIGQMEWLGELHPFLELPPV